MCFSVVSINPALYVTTALFHSVLTESVYIITAAPVIRCNTDETKRSVSCIQKLFFPLLLIGRGEVGVWQKEK